MVGGSDKENFSSQSLILFRCKTWKSFLCDCVFGTHCGPLMQHATHLCIICPGVKQMQPLYEMQSQQPPLHTHGAPCFQKASMPVCVFKLRTGGFKMKCKPWILLWPLLPLPFPNSHSLGSLLLCSVVACACTLLSSCSRLLLWAETTIALLSFVISVAAFLKWYYSHLGGL